jgi:hypothetical protein
MSAVWGLAFCAVMFGLGWVAGGGGEPKPAPKPEPARPPNDAADLLADLNHAIWQRDLAPHVNRGRMLLERDAAEGRTYPLPKERRAR